MKKLFNILLFIPLRELRITKEYAKDCAQPDQVFFLGMREFRMNCTTHFDYPEIEVYDGGREFAHRLTLRYFEDEKPRFWRWVYSVRRTLRRARSRFTIIDLIMAAPALTALMYRITLTL